MARRTGLQVKMSISGVREVLAALAKLPKDASNELRDASLEISRKLAAAAQGNARTEGSQAALVGATVKPARDRVPAVQAGGTKRLGRNRAMAYKLLFGSEFGSNFYRQFGKPHVGQGSYWFFRTIEDEQVMIQREWLDAADAIVRKYGEAS